MRKKGAKRVVGPVGGRRRKIDPRLQQVLSRASADATIDAVIMFRDQGKGAVGTKKSGPEKAVEQLARTEPIEYNFFPNLGAVAVRTNSRALKKLLDLPDVTTATVDELSRESP